MLKLVLLLVAIAAAANAQGNRVNIQPCNTGSAMPDWFESDHCGADHVCVLTRGQIFLGRAQVSERRTFHVLNVGLRATLLGFPFELSIPEGFEDACDFLEGDRSCPTVAGAIYVWALQFPVATHYPAVTIWVECKFIKFSTLL